MVKCKNETEYDIPKDVLKEIINRALRKTLNDCAINGGNNKPGKDHNIKSQKWVKNFAQQLKNYYEDNIKVFYRDKNSKEFLFDISVGQCSIFKTARSKKPREYISKAIWQIESEFEENATEIAYDFSKLLSGNAPLKMMVGPLRVEEDSEGPTYYMDAMKLIAKEIPEDEDWYFLLITHPKNWEKGKEMVWKIFKWEENDWSEMTPGGCWVI